MARKIAEGLDRAGVDVSVCVLRTAELRARQAIGDIPVIAPHPLAFFAGSRIFSEFKADVYHSQEPTLGTYQLRKTFPGAVHVVTSIDPRDDADWSEEFRRFSLKKKLLYPVIRGFEDAGRVHEAVRIADQVICQTKFIIPKVKQMYRPQTEPMFIGSATTFPNGLPRKASKPTVCFLARLDKRKRPELFFELAKANPHVDFIVIGKAHDAAWDGELRERYGNLGNLEMLGYVNPFQSNKINEVLEKSWILVNTASREGLPAAFVEAASYRCAILATVNPDDFASEFGYFAEEPKALADGLDYLLSGDRWRACGEKGYAYVHENFEESHVVQKHLDLYESLRRS
ncbi:MAG: glycosyltransferase family 4 protein [Candidatus Hydrogenedentes bacterium]|nr:glycosyltransferase family 4 protein [Candidatus Hydrogenedentota bacterium]